MWTSRRLPPRFGMTSFPAGLAVAAAVSFGADPARAEERVDLDAVYRIKDEGFQRSKVMELMSYLTDVHGPRLTGSPNSRAAADYAIKKLSEWGLTKPRLEKWGPFGRGWTSERFTAHAITPQSYPLIGWAKAWTPGTNGSVTGEVVHASVQTDKDMETWKGKLRGKVVFVASMREVRALFEPPGKRFTDAELADMAKAPEPGRPQGVLSVRAEAEQERARAMGGGDSPRPAIPLYVAPPDPGFPSSASAAGGAAARRAQRDFALRRMKFFLDEGVVALVEPGRGDGGTVFVQGGGPRDPKEPPVAPQVVLSVEHYGRIFRTLEKKLPVTIELNIQNKLHDGDGSSFNVVADLPGTDKSGEIVMIGAHIDSWHAGTGATDNASGVAVMMEAMRILKTAGLKPRRTIRIGLWNGEEQGLLGSRAYVREHLADRDTMKLKTDHAKISGYFNLDNGTGAIRGIYLQANETVAPIFDAFMAPFRNLGMTTITIRSTGSTDHVAFDAVGVPGFQFIQDQIEYGSRTHHSSMDVYERIQAADMMKNAVIVASFAYHTAHREAKLPRKPLPKPREKEPTDKPAGDKAPGDDRVTQNDRGE